MDGEISSLLSICREIVSELDFERVVEKVVKGAVEYVSGDAGAIGMLDEEGNIFYPYLFNLPEKIKSIKWKGIGGIAGVIVREGKPLILDDYPGHPEATPAYVEAGVKTLLAVPLIYRGKTFGALGVFGKTPDKKFSATHLEPVEIFATFASIAIQNALQHKSVKKAYEIIEEKELFYRTVVDQATDLLAVLMTDGTINFMNKALRTIVPEGFSEGSNFKFLIDESDRMLWKMNFEDIRTGEIHKTIDAIKILTKNGSKEVAMSMALVTCISQSFVTVSMKDLTQIRTLYEELLRTSKLATLGEIAAALAHEINNPLIAIRSSAELLLRKSPPSPENIQDKLGIILDNVGKISRIVRQFLNLGKPRGSRHPVKFDVCLETEDLIKSLEKIYSAEGVIIDRSFPPEPVIIFGFPDEYRQVLLNLLSNAFNAIVESGTGNAIKIEITKSGSWINVRVRDNGPGIPEEIKEKIFEPFFTTRKAGIGLGLAIVKRIVDTQRWKIKMRSEKEVTEFELKIPVSIEGGEKNNLPGLKGQKA